MAKKGKKMSKEPIPSYLVKQGTRWYLKGKDLKLVGLDDQDPLHVMMYPDDNMIVFGKSIDDIKRKMGK